MSLKLSLKHTATERRVLLSTTKAIKAMEEITGTIKEFYATPQDTIAFHNAFRLLWSILIANTYIIDVDTNRLKKEKLP